MKWFPALSLTLALVAGGPAVTAQDLDVSDEMWARFYEKLSAVIKQGNKDSKLVVSLSVPGTPLVPLKQSDLNDASYVNDLLAMAPTYNTVWTPSNITVASIYRKILDHHVNLPITPLTATERAELEANERILEEKLDNFQDWEMRLAIISEQVAQEKLEDFLKKGGVGRFNASTTSTMNEKHVKEAFEGKSTVMFRYYDDKSQKFPGGAALEVIAAQNRVRELQSRDPARWWARLAQEFERGKINDTFQIQSFPPIDQWADDKGWVKFTYSASDKLDETSLSEQDIKAGGNFKKGIVSVKAKFAKSDSVSTALAKDASLKITMEMKRVTFRRPWLDASVFSDKRWDWAPGTGGQVSDGKGGGDLPMLPVSLIIVRNVKFISKAMEEFAKETASAMEVSAKVGIGPFSANASYSRNNKTASTHLKKVAGGIEIPEPQIIGYVSTMLDKCPDPKR
jgi:hypothetical protein